MSDKYLVGFSNDGCNVFNNLTISENGAIRIPFGPSNERPPTGLPGMIRYNNENNIVEFHNNDTWSPISDLPSGSSGDVIISDGAGGIDSTTSLNVNPLNGNITGGFTTINVDTIFPNTSNVLKLYTDPTTEAIEVRTAQFYPRTNDATLFGGSGNRFSTGYFVDLTYNGTLTNDSDDRIKSNEKLITQGVSLIEQLQPKIYDKHNSLRVPADKEDTDLTGIDYFKESGFIAQDVDKITDLKHLVHYDKTSDLYSLNYVGIIPYLVQSIKELNARIKVLESK